MDTFSFNFEAFDFWPIYDTIKKYYPIGIPFNDREYEFYRSYPGAKELTKLVLDNIHDNKNFRERWKSFEKHLKVKLKKEVIGTTFAQAPSFSSYIIIEQQEQKGVSYYKELHFTVSLLGPYYSIYGLDSSIVYLKLEGFGKDEGERPGMFQAINAITVSPFLEYEEHFLAVEGHIKEKYPDYRLIPFEINSMVINGLQVDHIQKEKSNVFNAIFHDNHQLDGIMRRGNDYYGCNSWRI